MKFDLILGDVMLGPSTSKCVRPPVPDRSQRWCGDPMLDGYMHAGCASPRLSRTVHHVLCTLEVPTHTNSTVSNRKPGKMVLSRIHRRSTTRHLGDDSARSAPGYVNESEHRARAPQYCLRAISQSSSKHCAKIDHQPSRSQLLCCSSPLMQDAAASSSIRSDIPDPKQMSKVVAPAQADVGTTEGDRGSLIAARLSVAVAVAHWTRRSDIVAVPRTLTELHSVFWLHPTPIAAVCFIFGLLLSICSQFQIGVIDFAGKILLQLMSSGCTNQWHIYIASKQCPDITHSGGHS